MVNQTLDWQIVSDRNTETVQLCQLFGARYDFTENELEAFRLSMLYGIDDDELMKMMRIPAEELDNLLTCMLGKSRTNSTRELQALFLRYIMQKLPALAAEAR